MEIIPRIIVYHTNDVKRSEEFLTNNKYIIISEDLDWLGKGMYFGDNISNAKYWIQKKKKDYNEVMITESIIALDENLDLTDDSILIRIEELWKEFCIKEKETIDNINHNIYLKNPDINQITGKKLDFLFDYFELEKVYKTIKAIGVYPNKKENKFFYKSNLSYGHLTGSAKVIYCVKDYRKINSRKKEGVY